MELEKACSSRLPLEYCLMGIKVISLDSSKDSVANFQSLSNDRERHLTLMHQEPCLYQQCLLLLLQSPLSYRSPLVRESSNIPLLHFLFWFNYWCCTHVVMVDST